MALIQVSARLNPIQLRRAQKALGAKTTRSQNWGLILNRAWGRTIGAILPFNTSVDVMFETSILMTPRLGRFPMWRFGHPTV